MNEPLYVTLNEYYRLLFAPPDVSRFPNRHIEALPDVYRKDPESTNNKLLSIPERALEELRRDIRDVFDMVALDRASGETLNLYGQMLDQPRGRLNDRQYRSMVRAQIACNLSKGDYISVLAAVRMMLNCGNELVNIVELEHENCAVRVDSIPYAALVQTGLSTRQVIALIKRLIPIAVRIESSNFEGTFEFGADDPMEYDEKRGFADIAQTIGGYFGATAGDDDNAFALPISEF